MAYKCLKSWLCFWNRLKYYSSSLSEYMSKSESHSVPLSSSSSSFMQTDSIDVGNTSPSDHWIIYFLSTKFHPNFSGKNGIVFELKALWHMSPTSVVRKIFSCNTHKYGGQQPPSVFLMFPFKTLSFLFGLYFFKKMSSHASSIEVNFFLPYIAQVNFSMVLKVVWISLSLSNCPFKTEKLFACFHFSQVISKVEFCR